MRTPANVYANELQAQHTIQSNDLLKICHLAKVENTFEKVESFSFEQFFGFACHLFITTESQSCREQLAVILPKFGSIAVFSLLKISHHLSDSNSTLQREQQIAKLAAQALQAMPVDTLTIGLAQALEDNESSHSHHNIFSIVAPALITLTAHHGENILARLSQKLSPRTWNTLQQNLLQTLSGLRAQPSAYPAPVHNRENRIKVKVKEASRQFAEAV